MDNSTHDIVFVLDTTRSIGYFHFRLIKELVANITIGFINDSPSSAVGVIVFNADAYLKFNLQAYTSLSTLLSAINELTYNRRKRTTNTDEALTLLLTTAKNGALGLRQNSTKVAIIITDGESDDKSATLSAAAKLHVSNIFNIYAVGVGSANLTELEAIASDPEFVFIADTFTSVGLAKLIDKYLPRLLNPGCNSKYLANGCIHTCII